MTVPLSLCLTGSFACSGTAFFPTGEVPFIREINALLRLHRLNFTSCIRKHNASTIRSINQGKSSPTGLQTAIFIDEIFLIHLQKCSNSRNVCICQANIALPSATGSATLACMNYWLSHMAQDTIRPPRVYASLPLCVAGGHKWVLPVCFQDLPVPHR